MDETTKILIGTLSGFVIAFFAEPVKIYFQNRAQIRNLRISLYREMVHNYSVLKTIFHTSSIQTPIVKGTANKSKYRLEAITTVAKNGIKTQCYEQATNNNLIYQLYEATYIHIIYLYLPVLNEFLYDKNLEPKNIIDFVGSVADKYITEFALLFHTRNLDMKTMKKSIPNDLYQEIISKGKELNEAETQKAHIKQ